MIPQPSSPDYLKDLAQFEQAASAEYCSFSPIIQPIQFERMVKKVYGWGESDETKVKSFVEVLKKKLDVFEEILGGQKYMVGNEFSLVDIWVGLLSLFNIKGVISILYNVHSVYLTQRDCINLGKGI